MYKLIILLFVGLSCESAAQISKRTFASFDFKGKEVRYAIQLPSDFDDTKSYPVAIGPSDVESNDDQCHYWRGVKDTEGWILLDFPIYKGNKILVSALFDHIRKKYNVEGNKFHAICFSANSAGVFDLVMNMPDDFESITGVAGNPGSRDIEKLSKLKKVKVQFIVGDKDRYWMNAAKDRHALLLEAGVASQIEIIKNGPHVLNELVGKGVLSRMDKLRVK